MWAGVAEKPGIKRGVIDNPLVCTCAEKYYRDQQLQMDFVLKFRVSNRLIFPAKSV